MKRIFNSLLIACFSLVMLFGVANAAQPVVPADPMAPAAPVTPPPATTAPYAGDVTATTAPSNFVWTNTYTVLAILFVVALVAIGMWMSRSRRHRVDGVPTMRHGDNVHPTTAPHTNAPRIDPV